LRDSAGRFVAALIVSGLIAACGGETIVEPPAPALLRVVSVPAEAEAMEPIGSQIVVEVVDAEGRATTAALPVTVTAEGVGHVAAPVTVTSVGGRATFGELTLATAAGQPGSVTLRFTSPGLVAATASLTLECQTTNVDAEPITTRALAAGDCTTPEGLPYHRVQSVSTNNTALRFTLSGVQQATLRVAGPDETKGYWGHHWSWPSGEASFRVLGGPGTSRGMIVATSAAGGGYTLTTARTNESLETPPCEPILITAPLVTIQAIDRNCVFDGGSDYDLFYFGLRPGATATVTMTGAQHAPYLRIVRIIRYTEFGSQYEELARAPTGAASTSVSYTNTTATDGWYAIAATFLVPGAWGPYTLQFNVTN
jgi:hypothetical protein